MSRETEEPIRCDKCGLILQEYEKILITSRDGWTTAQCTLCAPLVALTPAVAKIIRDCEASREQYAAAKQKAPRWEKAAYWLIDRIQYFIYKYR